MSDDQLKETLIRIDERTKNIDEKLDGQALRLNFHGDRIRNLENWRWFLGGGLALLGAGMSFVAKVVAK